MKKQVWLLCLLLLLFMTAGCGKQTPAQAAIPSPEPVVTPKPSSAPPAEPADDSGIVPVEEPVPELPALSPEPALYAPYAELIQKTVEGIQTGWSDYTPEELGVSDIFKRAQDMRLGWLQRDINGDGVDELLFGKITEDSEPSAVFDIYCLVGQTVSHPAAGWEYNCWYLLPDGHLMNEYSSTGYDLYRNAYGLFNGVLVPARLWVERSEYLHLDFTDFSEFSALS